jgi:hypothetical protein
VQLTGLEAESSGLFQGNAPVYAKGAPS